MRARMMLTVTTGPSQGQEFTFDERTTCVVGRGKDCQPMLPTEEEHRVISHHHYMFDITRPNSAFAISGAATACFSNCKRGSEQ